MTFFYHEIYFIPLPGGRYNDESPRRGTENSAILVADWPKARKILGWKPEVSCGGGGPCCPLSTTVRRNLFILGQDFETAIKDWVGLIVGMTGLGGKMVLDKTKPFGQPRRMLDTTKAERYFGFKAKTPFEEGLRKTVDWRRRQPRKSS